MISRNSSKRHLPQRWWYCLLLPAWTYAAFFLAQWLVVCCLHGLKALGVSFQAVNQTVYGAVVSVVVYVISLVLVVGVPMWLFGRRTTARDLGVDSRPAWPDILLAPLAVVAYFICSSLVMMLAVRFLQVDTQVQQQLPFHPQMVTSQWDLVWIFVTLVVMAPLAEELLFRGYLYGKLRKVTPIWLAIALTSLLFGAAHLWAGPGSSQLQWAVAIDTCVLSAFLCVTREYTGALWTSVLLHASKNGLAFYLLYMSPDLVRQLKQVSMILGGGI